MKSYNYLYFAFYKWVPIIYVFHTTDEAEALMAELKDFTLFKGNYKRLLSDISVTKLISYDELCKLDIK